MAFREEAAREVRARVNLAEIVGEYLSLKRSGSGFVGLCPFHDEDTPSFHVSAEKGLFYCFGCQTGGDVFDFVRKKEGLSFPEALRVLAARVGVPLEEPGGVQRDRERWQELLTEANRYYRENLGGPGGEPGRRYLAGRGLQPSTIERFGLGYAPGVWDGLVRRLKSRGFTEEELLAAGVAARRRQGSGVVDLLRERVIFPIQDALGRVVGFGGRILEGGEGPKYLNSPETEFFRKRRLLYGLYQARQAFRERRRALVVEGYLDVLTCHQAGFSEAVAGLGTAFGPEQLNELGRRTEEIFLGFDTDRAGAEATRRVLEAAGQLRLRIVRWPEVKDPDEFLNRRGPEAFAQLLAEAPDAAEFLIEESISRHQGAGGRWKSLVAGEILPVLGRLSPVERDEYLRQLSHRLGVSEEALRSEAAQKHRVEKKWHNTRNNSENMPSAGDPAETLLLMVMLREPSYRERGKRELRAEDFREPVGRSLFEALMAVTSNDPLSHLEPELRAAAAGLELDGRPLTEPERLWRDGLDRLAERRLRDLQGRLKDGQGTIDEVREYQELLRSLRGSRIREGGGDGGR